MRACTAPVSPAISRLVSLTASGGLAAMRRASLATWLVELICLTISVTSHSQRRLRIERVAEDQMLRRKLPPDQHRAGARNCRLGHQGKIDERERKDRVRPREHEVAVEQQCRTDPDCRTANAGDHHLREGGEGV
jgi:hypothetical protein